MTPTQKLPFIDIHCHLLPGLDDGAPNWNATLAMARMAVAEGIGTVIVTPHQLGRYERNTPNIIRHLTAEAQRRIDTAGIPLVLLPGAEVRVHERLPELLRTDHVLTVADNHQHVLLDLPHDIVLPLGRLSAELHEQGTRCILSHPERNQALMNRVDQLRLWVKQGCLVQVTAGSITGNFGGKARHASRTLLEAGLVHFVATDAHDLRFRPPHLRKAYVQVRHWLGVEYADQLFCVNPSRLTQPAIEACPTRPAASTRGLVATADQGSGIRKDIPDPDPRSLIPDPWSLILSCSRQRGCSTHHGRRG